MEEDPICGMSIDPATARHPSEHEGKTYNFCVPDAEKAARFASAEAIRWIEWG